MKAALKIMLCCLLTGCSGRIPEAISHFSLSTPRPFGYVLGDEIEHRIEVDVRKGITLQRDSLPEIGPLNRWLDIRQVHYSRSGHGQNNRYRITLRYQVFYAPLEVKMLSIPGFDLRFSQGMNVLKQSVPEWQFTISPLRELAIRRQDGKQYRRADGLLPVDRANGLWLWAAFCFAVAGAAAVYLAYLHGWLTLFSRRRIFKRALEAIERSSGQPSRVQFKLMHDAFNRLNQEVLFRNGLESFYSRHPAYQTLSTDLEWFFECSDRMYFFDQSDDPDTADKLKRLCRQCRMIERSAI